MTEGVDRLSIKGKAPRPEKRVPLVVIGAGIAGTAAAIEAARAGVEVMLVDENPVGMSMMGLEVPLHYGGRMQPTVQNKATMLERVLQSNPALTEAYDAGVDVQLGTYVWGAFRNTRNVRELEGSMVGLADEERSWLVGYNTLVVAAGARDLGMGFSGWGKAGVMGANGAHSLLTRYRALSSQRMVVLGSGNVGLRTAALALERGVEVAGVVEVSPQVRGDDALRSQLESRGVPFYTAHTVKEAKGSADEVRSIVIVEVGGDLKPIAGSEKEIACDTVCLAIGLVPVVELLDLLECRLPFRSGLGGFVPEIDEWMQTTAPGVFVAGDCAGFHDGMIANSDIARDQGRLAGIAAAESLGAVASGRAGTLRAQLQHLNGAGSSGVHTHWATWLHSIVDVSGYEAHTCQCEEVTRREVADVQPPRYLHWSSQEMSARSLKTLAKDGPINQDQIKRLTRAGMGHCQGRRCREQIALLLADEAGTDVSQIPMPSYRAPVRPLPLYVMWPDDEPEEMRENWTGWFGIRSAMRGRMAGLGGLLSTRVGGIPKPVPAKQGSGSTPAGQQ